MTNTDFRTLRKTAGMTQQQFANELGVSRKTVVEIECGRAAITVRTEKAAINVTSCYTIEKLRFLSAIASQ
jgi:DNA-binding XRE family transcriptional regulator